MSQNKNNYTQGEFVIDGNQFKFNCVWQHQSIEKLIIGVTFDDLNLSAYEYIIEHTYAQSSTLYQNPQYSNQLWHIVVKWWVDTLRKRKAH